MTKVLFVILAFPVAVAWCLLRPLLALALVLWLGLFYGPWYNVVKPIHPDTLEHIQAVVARGHGRVLRITKRFYLCFDARAPYFYDRVFFVRVRTEE